MMRRLPFRFSLLVSVAGVMALSGCDTSNLADKITGREGRKEQMVDGPRRAPLLNPQGGAMPGNQPPVNMPAAAQPAPAAAPAASAAAADNPFDQYDEHGRKVASAPAKPIEMADGEGDEPGTVSSGFFDRFIPDRASDAPAAQPLDERKQERKPFAGNVPSAMGTEKVAPQPEPIVLAKSETLPASMAAPIVPDAVQTAEFKPVPTLQNTTSAPVKAESAKPAAEEDTVGGFVPLLPSVNAAVSPPPAAASEMQVQPAQPAPEKAALASSAADDASASEPSMISRLFSSLAGKPQPAPQGEEAEPFPELSSVPQLPKEFGKAKSDQKQQVATLKADHALAQEQKEALDAEPASFPETVAAFKPEPAEASPPPPVDVTTSGGKTVLLGRLSDAQESDQPALAAPVAEAKNNASTEAEAAPPAPAQSFWSRLGFGGSKDEADQPSSDRINAPKPAPAMITESPASTVAPFVPMTQEAPAAPVSMAAPEPQPAVSNEQEQEKPAELASPEVLKDVKTLPPSRYAPPRQRQYYLAY